MIKPSLLVSLLFAIACGNSAITIGSACTTQNDCTAPYSVCENGVCVNDTRDGTLGSTDQSLLPAEAGTIPDAGSPVDLTGVSGACGAQTCGAGQYCYVGCCGFFGCTPPPPVCTNIPTACTTNFSCTCMNQAAVCCDDLTGVTVTCRSCP